MRRTFLSLCLAGLLTAFAGAPAAAATLRIDITDLDLTFGHDSIFTGDENDVFDELVSMDFFLDDVKIGTLSSDIWAYVGIYGVGNIPTTGGSVSAVGGQFTLLTGSIFNGVAIDLKDISLNFLPVGANLKLAGVASSNAFEQLGLPFGAEFNPAAPIDVLFMLNLSNVEAYEGYIQSFNASGTGSVEGQSNVVPEPTSMLLLGSGLIGAVSMRRRQQAKARKA